MDAFQKELIDRLARIEEQLKVLTALPQRVEQLERWRAYLVGIGAGIGSVITIAWKKLLGA
jgi:hypothetical protein